PRVPAHSQVSGTSLLLTISSASRHGAVKKNNQPQLRPDVRPRSTTSPQLSAHSRPRFANYSQESQWLQSPLRYAGADTSIFLLMASCPTMTATPFLAQRRRSVSCPSDQTSSPSSAADSMPKNAHSILSTRAKCSLSKPVE